DWSERFKDAEFYTLEKGEGYPPDEETNVDGLRDFTRAEETAEGLRRIVVLGDSVTFGHGLEASQAFPRLLERSHQRADEVFNVALPGWSTRQERLAYERIARKYKPNAVILAVCLNDLAELQINLTKPPALLLSLFKHSAAVRLALGASNREIGAVEELFREPNSARVHDAFRLFFQEVRALRDEVLKDGATFQVVVFPFRFQFEPNAPPPSVQERIATFGSTDDIPVLDVLKELKREKNPAELFLDYDHFSEAGHVRIAQLLDLELRKSFPSRWVDAVPSPFRNAAQALAELGPPASDVDEFTLWRIREQASEFEEGSTSGLSEALVEAAVSNPSPRVRFEAARTVFYLGLPGALSVPALIRGVQHEDPRVRAFATWTLGEMGEIARPAIPALVALARQDGGAGKTGAFTAIGKIGGDSPETIPLLVQELKHPKEARRYRAARTIGRMGPSAAAAVPGLTEALRDPSALVRLHVVRAFGNIGEAAKPALPALIEVLNKDPDPEVRKEVSLTLSKLPGR
ncbi:MAG TPA: HEAT repeat domain-containing protein, partial [Vicinamibacteria bacterium]|nr:HEAT repeat domain-containing protein [Vicinamibacteria bacterium]